MGGGEDVERCVSDESTNCFLATRAVVIDVKSALVVLLGFE
jgi:hypothetical protein